MARKRPFSRIAPLLDPAFSALGFSRLNARESLFARGASAWRRPQGAADHLVCDLQPWKWGYDPWFGSSFTLNFWRVPNDFETTFEHSRTLRTRLMWLTDLTDCEQIAAIQNQVLAKARIPTPDEYQKEKFLPMSSLDLRQYQDTASPVVPEKIQCSDLWLAFLDEGDVAVWCAYLAEWLPKGVERFASLEDVAGHLDKDPERMPWIARLERP